MLFIMFCYWRVIISVGSIMCFGWHFINPLAGQNARRVVINFSRTSVSLGFLLEIDVLAPPVTVAVGDPGMHGTSSPSINVQTPWEPLSQTPGKLDKNDKKNVKCKARTCYGWIRGLKRQVGSWNDRKFGEFLRNIRKEAICRKYLWYSRWVPLWENILFSFPMRRS